MLYEYDYLPAKIAGETYTVEVDFATVLNGATISSGAVTAAVYTGTDASPSAIISGSATVSGTKIQQKITGGVAGVVYRLTFTATLASSAGTRILRRLMEVKA